MFPDTEELSTSERGHAFADLHDAKVAAEQSHCSIERKPTAKPCK
jgi:hypothetical protein